MHATYRMNVDELDDRFLETLKTIFNGREIEISVSEAAAYEDDETEYLMRSPANREHLLQALEDIAHSHNLVSVNADDMQ